MTTINLTDEQKQVLLETIDWAIDELDMDALSDIELLNSIVRQIEGSK